MALTDLTRISTSGIATGSTIDSPILRKDVDFRGSQVGVTSSLFDSSDDALELNDNVKLKFGNHSDIQIYNDGTKSVIKNGGSSLGVNNNSLHIYSQNDILHNTTYSQYFHCGAANENSISPKQLALIRNEGVKAYYNNNLKFETVETGAVVTGVLTATSFSGPTHNTSGIATFYDLRVSNNLTVEGTTTTLDTNLTGVDRVEVNANSNSDTAIIGIQTGTADIVNLLDGTTEVLTVIDGGNVGIGSQIPAAKLDVVGDTLLDDVNISGVTTTGNIIVGAGSTIKIPNKIMHVGDETTNINFHDTEKFRIELGGVTPAFSGLKSTSGATHAKWGINVATPQAALHIDEAYNHQGVLRVTNGNQGSGYYHQLEMSGTQNIFALWKHYDGSNYYNTYAYGSTGHKWYIDGEEKLRVHDDGNVGIGTNNPTQKLEVKYGEAWIDNSSGDSQARANGLTVSHTHGVDFALESDPGDDKRVATFAVKGSSRAAIVALRNVDDNSAFWDFIADGNTNKFYIQRGGSGGAALGPAVSIDTSLNVGIGTGNTVGARLRVQKDGLDEMLQQWGGRQGPTAGQRFMQLYSPEIDSGSDYFRFQTGNAFKFQVDTLDALCINSAGRVGIGTDDPQTALEIGKTHTDPVIRLNDVDNRRMSIRGPSANNIASVGTESSNDLMFFTNGYSNERFRITGDGLIGINYPNTTTGLTISKYGTLPVPNGNTYPYPAGKWSSAWNTTTANNEDYWVGFTGSYNVSSATVNICLQPNTFNFSTQQGMYIAGEATATDAADFTVGKLIGGSVGGASTVAGTKRATKDELFRIKSNGNVGIGTDNPGERLDVDGSIRLRAGGNWTTYATKITSRLDSTHMLSLEAYQNSSTAIEILGTYADSGGANVRTVINSGGQPVLIGGLTGQVPTQDTSKLAVNGGGNNIGIIQVHADGGETDGDLSGIAFSHGGSSTETSRAKAAIALRATGSYGLGDLCFYVDGTSDNNAVSDADEKVRITKEGELRIAPRNTNNAGDFGFRFGSFGLRTEDVGSYNWWRIDASYGSFNPFIALRADRRIGVYNATPAARVDFGYDGNQHAAFITFKGPHNKSGEMRHKYVHNGSGASSNTVDLLEVTSFQSPNSHIYGRVTVMGVSPVADYGFKVEGYFYLERGSSNTTGTNAQVGTMDLQGGSSQQRGTGSNAQGTLSWSGLTLRYETAAVAYGNMHINVEYHAYDGATVVFKPESVSF